MYKKWGKRLFDIILSLILIALFLPLGLLVWVVAILDCGWPGIFRQPRIGLHGKTFGLLKFKTLQGQVLHNVPWKDLYNQQASPIGQFLRYHCLDELPQLLNVIAGQMSLVGPRPWQDKNFKLARLSCRDRAKRNSVKSGLTGLAQVYLCKEQRRNLPLVAQYDLMHCENISLPTDCFILLKTIRVMFYGH